jgi:CheY-like chemotaxis protein
VKVLVVDNNSNIRDLFEEELPLLGYDTLVQKNALKALQSWNEFLPDIVFSGSHFQDMDSMDFLVTAREKYGKKTPIYIMSSCNVYHPEKYIEKGANGLIDKNKDLGLIFSLIAKHHN